MLSIDYIRENQEKVKQAAKNKNREIDLEKILQLDDQRRELIGKVQKLREERNVLAKQKFTEETKKRGIEIKEELKGVEEKLNQVESDLHTLMSYIPNVPLDEVPIGKDSSANVEIKKVGEPTQFSFEPKSHL
jgi:seryl-tRNA synthetase